MAICGPPCSPGQVRLKDEDMVSFVLSDLNLFPNDKF